MSQEKLDKTDLHIHTLLDKTGTGYIEIDIAGRVFNVNKAYCNMLGADSTIEVIGRCIFEWTDQDSIEAQTLAIAQCAEQGDIKKLICQYQTFQGKNITISLDAYAEQHNGSTRIYAMCQDITQQAIKEQSVAKKQYQLNIALDAAKAGMFYYDFVKDVTYWDRRSHIIFDVDPSSFQHNYASWEALIHPNDVKSTLEKFQQAIATQNEFELEYRIITSKGVRHINVKAKIVRDQKGKVLMCHGLHQDVTDSNKIADLLLAKKALETSQANMLKQTKLLRSIIDSIPDLIFYKDIEGCFLGCNKAFEDFVNIKESELIGKTDYDLFDFELAYFFRTKDKQVLDANCAKTNEEWVTYANGEKVLLEALKTPFLGGGCKAVGLLGIARNITERKNSEIRYQTLMNENNIIFDNIPVGVAYIKGRKFVRVNQHWVDLFGWTEEEIINHPPEINYFYKRDFKAERQAAYPEMKKGLVYRSERQMIHKNGKAIWCQISGQLIDVNEPEKGSIWIVNDIDKEKLLRDSLRLEKESSDQLKEIAEKSNQAKSDFLANMSHELRTPMHAILSFSHFGLKKLETSEYDKLERYFLHIHTSGQRLLLLLNDLLDLSKLESGKMNFTFGYGKISQSINNCLNEQQTRLEEKKISIVRNNFENDFDIQMDFFKISQVITNIVSNAIKFTPKGKTISFTLAKQKMHLGQPIRPVPALKVDVSDEGVGIPEDEVTLVFDQFVQSSKTDDKSGGTGLGLSISRKIIEGHQGVIWAENNPDGGATFSFSIPINRIENSLET